MAEGNRELVTNDDMTESYSSEATSVSMAEGNRELVTNDVVTESYSSEVEINENTLANIANENIRKQLMDTMDPNFGLLDNLLENKTLDRNEFEFVKSPDTTYERNVRLFDIITKKRKYRELFEALRDSNQKHLVNYVTENGVFRKRYSKVWPLTSREMNILNCNQGFLVNTIDVSNNELIGKLYATGFLNKRQREHLCELPHSYKKTETLLDMLQRSSLNGYSQMIVCLLEMNQPHVAQLLNEGGVAVPVHNTIDGEGEAQSRDEEELVTQIQILLQDRPVGKALRVLETLQLRLIAGKRGQSVVLYILCKSLNDLSLLFDLLKTGELRKRIQRFFNDLVQRSDRIVVTTILPNYDFEKCKKYFEVTSVRVVEGNRELVTNDDMTPSYSNEDELGKEDVMRENARINKPSPANYVDSLVHHLTSVSSLLSWLNIYSMDPSYSILPSILLLYYKIYQNITPQSDNVVSSFVFIASVPLLGLLIFYYIDKIIPYVVVPLCTLSSLYILCYELSRNITCTLLSEDVVRSFVYIASVPIFLFSYGLHSIASGFAIAICTSSLIFLTYRCFSRALINPSYSSKWRMCLAVFGTMLIAVFVTEIIGIWAIPQLLSLMEPHMICFVLQFIDSFPPIKGTHLYGLNQWLMLALMTEILNDRWLGRYFIYSLYRLTLVLWACNYLLPQRGFSPSVEIWKVPST